MPRASPKGPALSESETTSRSDRRKSYSVSTSGKLRPGTLRPHGIPAGATSTSRSTRSGLSAASSAATRPPSE